MEQWFTNIYILFFTHTNIDNHEHFYFLFWFVNLVDRAFERFHSISICKYLHRQLVEYSSFVFLDIVPEYFIVLLAFTRGYACVYVVGVKKYFLKAYHKYQTLSLVVPKAISMRNFIYSE